MKEREGANTAKDQWYFSKLVKRRSASLDHLHPHLSSSHPDQVVCTIYLHRIAKGDMKEEVFKEFIREVQQAPNDFQAVPLQEEDRLKLRAKYSSAVSSDKERAKKHRVVGDTCSYEEMVSLAEHSGRMCTRTFMVGSFDSSTVPPYLLLSFNRIHNRYGRCLQQHHTENLEVILWVCNAAMGADTTSDLDNCINALKNTTYLLD